MQCKAMIEVPKNEIKFELITYTLESLKHHQDKIPMLRVGFNNAILFEMDESLKIDMFDQGLREVEKGGYQLVAIYEVNNSAYKAHVLFGDEGNWTRIRHCGYSGQENIWFEGLTIIFEEIQKLTKKPLAGLVFDTLENNLWKSVMTSLAFVPQPNIARPEAYGACTWYVRPPVECSKKD